MSQVSLAEQYLYTPVHNYISIFFIVPSVTVEISEAPGLYSGDSVELTCTISLHKNVDTAVNVTFTWIRTKTNSAASEKLTLSPTQNSIQAKTTFHNLTSLDTSIVCMGVANPLQEEYINASQEESRTVKLSVAGT